MKNFLVVLFKNKKKKRIIKDYSTEKNALKKFNDLINSSEKIIFDINYENGKKSNYELLLLSKSNQQQKIFYKDEFGRNNRVFIENNDNYSVLKISDYKIEEFIYDWRLCKRISFTDFLIIYFSDKNLKVLSLLNNKLVLQNDEKFFIFSLKNEHDAERLMYITEHQFMLSGNSNCLFVYDTSSSHKKWLYKILKEKGYKKSRLYRKSTNFSK